QHAAQGRGAGNWLDERYEQYVEPLRTLTQGSGDVEVAREALRRGIQKNLAEADGLAPGLFGWALDLLRIGNLVAFPWRLGATLRQLGDERQARSAFQPLVQALLATPPSVRSNMLLAALEEALRADDPRDALARMPRYMPQVARFVEATGWAAG